MKALRTKTRRSLADYCAPRRSLGARGNLWKKTLIRWTYLSTTWLLISLSCRAESSPILNVPSPDGRFQFIAKQDPKITNAAHVEFFLCDKNGKRLKEFNYTEFPVLAVKWHQSSTAVMVLEHIAQQEVMELFTLKKGRWEETEVEQLPDDVRCFNVVNAYSAGSYFKCYYIASNWNRDEWLACATEVNITTGKAKLITRKHVDIEDLPFYGESIGNIVYQLMKGPTEKPPHFQSMNGMDDEPDWYGMPNNAPRSQTLSGSAITHETPSR